MPIGRYMPVRKPISVPITVLAVLKAFSLEKNEVMKKTREVPEKSASIMSPTTLASAAGVIREPPSAIMYASARISVKSDMTRR
jgi:hypothetical protein